MITAHNKMPTALKSAILNEISMRREYITNYELSNLYALSPLVYAATEFWANNVEKVEWQVYDRHTGELVEDENNEIVRLVTNSDFRFSLGRTERTFRIWGRSLSKKVYNLFDELIGIEWVNPNLYSLQNTGPGNTLTGFYLTSGRGQYFEEITLPLNEAWYFTGFSFYEDYDGVSSAEAAFRHAATEPEMAQMMLSLFQNMGVPLAIVQPVEDAGASEFTQTETNRIRDWIASRIAGARNFGRTLVTSARWNWQTISVPFKDMELSGHYGPLREAVSQAFDVKLSFFTTGDARHDELEAQIQLWYRQSFSPHMERYAVSLTKQLCAHTRYEIRPDLSPILIEDEAGKIDNLDRKSKLGVISLGTIQTELGEESVPEFDNLFWYEGVGWIPKSEFANVWKMKLPNTQPAPGQGPPPPSITVSKPETEAPKALPAPLKVVAESEYVIPDEVYKEISIASHKALKAQGFTPEYLPQPTVDYIAHLAAEGLEKREIIHAAKSQYVSVKAAAAIAPVRAKFERQLDRLFKSAVSQGSTSLNRQTFQNLLTSFVNEACDDAALAGLRDGGIRNPELDDDEQAWVNNWKSDQRSFIANVTAAIYEDDRVTMDEAEGKAELWWNKSVAPAYAEMITSASKNAPFKRVMGATEEHCRDCSTIDGQVRRAKFWRAKGIWNASDRTQCGGYRCQCRNITTDEPVTRGPFPKLVGPPQGAKHAHA